MGTIRSIARRISDITGQVIGPIDYASWYTMVQLRSSIKYLKTKVGDNPKHRPAIEKEEAIYQELLQPYLEASKEDAVLSDVA